MSDRPDAPMTAEAKSSAAPSAAPVAGVLSDVIALDGATSFALEEIGHAPLVPPREPLGARVATVIGRHHTLLFTLSLLALWAITTLPTAWTGNTYRLGSRASHDILAPFSATLPDAAETARRRQQAAALVPPQYDPVPDAQNQALARLRLILVQQKGKITPPAAAQSRNRRVSSQNTRIPKESTRVLRESTRVPSENTRVSRGNTRVPSESTRVPTENTHVPSGITHVPSGITHVPSGITRFSRDNTRVPSRIMRVSSGNTRVASGEMLVTSGEARVSNGDGSDAARIATKRWLMVARASEIGVRAVYSSAQIRSDVAEDLVAARAHIWRAIEAAPLRLTPVEARLARVLAQQAAGVPNLVVNQKQTAFARRDAQRDVPDVFERIEADTPLVKQGEEITPELWARLQAFKLVAPRLDLAGAVANFVLCALLMGALAGYVLRFQKPLIERPAALWLTAVIPIFFLLIFRWMLRAPHADLTMAPVAATCAMLLTILIDARVGLMAGILVASLCALMARGDIGLFLGASLSAWIGALSVSEIVSRTQVMRAAALLALVGGALSGVVGTLRGAATDEIASMIVWGGLAGLVAVGAMAVLAMMLERPFGITTHLRLLELLAPDELVMKRMQSEAPGTYTHSLMVATLSEAAAKATNADPLLCRVGGLYHDIGKLRRPHCFIENQAGQNIHDRLSPQLSALVIVAHVKDGLQLGRTLRLPQPVLEIIAQHHGTGLVTYFYQRALNLAAKATEDDEANKNVDEANFRYAGPRPQSKEAAIVLLADSIEASSRALPDPTPEKLGAHIQAMIATRLSEGELSECDLTLRDLKTIEASFLHVLRGVMHHRIQYPDAAREQLLRDEANGEARDWMRPLDDARREDLGRSSRARGVRRPRNAKNAPPRLTCPPIATPVPSPDPTLALAATDPESAIASGTALAAKPSVTHPSNGHTPTFPSADTNIFKGAADCGISNGGHLGHDSRALDTRRTSNGANDNGHNGSKNPDTARTNDASNQARDHQDAANRAARD